MIIQVPPHTSPLNFAMVFIGTHFDGFGLVVTGLAFLGAIAFVIWVLWEGVFSPLMKRMGDYGMLDWFNPKTWFSNQHQREWDETNHLLNERARMLIKKDDVEGAAKVMEAIELHSRSKPEKRSWWGR